MKDKLLIGVLSLGILAGVCYGQEGYKNEATVSATGAFQKTANGNGVQQSGNDAAGVLFSYRYFFTDHQGVEVNYGFTRFDQEFNAPGISATNFGVSANTSEATASYIYKFGVIRHRLNPFVSAGTGALVFAPQNSFTVGNASSQTFATPDFVYSAGADLAVSRRVSLRLGYRGHVFSAPDFGIAGLNTASVTHIAEPFAGLSFHF
jgi:opacity protein-like surface antigen